MMTRPEGQKIVTWADVFSGPRWSHPGKALRNRIWVDPNLELVDCDEEKTWLRTTVRFVVVGPRFAIDELRVDLFSAIDEYNDDGPNPLRDGRHWDTA